MPHTPHVIPPKGVSDIAERLEQAGHDAWCVGGIVRDITLGQPGNDWDLASAMTPDEVIRRFPRTVPTGLAHGTVTILDRDGGAHEHTTFRRDMTTDGRHATVAFAKTIEEDLARRDFTINAMAFRPRTGTLCDPFGGRADALVGIVRAVGDPQQRMTEDRLRALRALRFAGRFDFAIDPATWDAILASTPHLGRLSIERVKGEIDKTFAQVKRPGATLARWQESGAFASVAPTLAAVTPVTFAAMDAAHQAAPTPEDAHLDTWTALCWELGEDQAAATLLHLKATTAEATHVRQMLAAWRGIGPTVQPMLEGGDMPDGRTLRRWGADIGRDRVAPLLRVTSARWTAERAAGHRAPDVLVDGMWQDTWRGEVSRATLSIRELAVNGKDLREAGVKPGPGMGLALTALLDAVVDDPTRNDSAWLLAHAATLATESAGAATLTQTSGTETAPPVVRA